MVAWHAFTGAAGVGMLDDYGPERLGLDTFASVAVS